LVRTWLGTLWVVTVLLPGVTLLRAADEGHEFFEKRIRPLLTEHCYSCHSTAAKKQKGGLLLDTRAAMLKGGDSGPAIVPRKAGASLLYRAVSYTDQELQMPPKGKLPDEAIADLRQWIALGAPDPRLATQAADTAARPFDLQEARQFWSFQ